MWLVVELNIDCGGDNEHSRLHAPRPSPPLNLPFVSFKDRKPIFRYTIAGCRVYCRQSANYLTVFAILQKSESQHGDPGQLWHAGSQDTDLHASCHVSVSTFVALCDQFTNYDTDRRYRTDGRTDVMLVA